MCGFANSVIILLKTQAGFSSNWKTLQRSDCTEQEGIPDLRALVKNCKFFQISSELMHAIIVGCSGTIAMNLKKKKNNGGKRLFR